MSELRCQPPLLQLLLPPISQRRVHVIAAAAIALLLHGRICRLRLHAALLICVLSQASTHDAVNRLSRLRAPWLLAVEARPPRVSSYTLLSAAYLAACAARWWLPAAAGVLLQLVIAALSLCWCSSRRGRVRCSCCCGCVCYCAPRCGSPPCCTSCRACAIARDVALAAAVACSVTPATRLPLLHRQLV